MIFFLLWIGATIFFYFLLCEMLFHYPLDDIADYFLFIVLYIASTAFGPILMYLTYLMNIGVLS